MKSKTLNQKLKEEAILHWEENLKFAKAKKFESINIGGNSCSFCRMYKIHCEPSKRPCGGCPIFKKTNQIYCRSTPYRKVYNILHPNYELANKIKPTILIKAIKEELDFLKSL